MIDPKAEVTYSQYNEDIILRALFHDVKKGFYIDIGANFPTVDSVTKVFYDIGWTGINIEPLTRAYLKLKQSRVRDVNLNLGVGSKVGVASFREYPDLSGHSTFEDSQKDAHKEKSLDYKVKLTTLNALFETYQVKHVHFLKIDVEGYEQRVLEGNDWSKNRPEVVCIEANHVSKDWRGVFADHQYTLFINDGLNEYYIAKEAQGRTEEFVERVIRLNYHAIKQHQKEAWEGDVEESERLRKLLEDNQTLIKDVSEKLARAEQEAQLSLNGKTYRGRLKRAIYGLTIDYLRYRFPSSPK